MIGVRLHGWLDDLVVGTYLAAAYLLGLSGTPLGIAIFGAVTHFALARLTRYPQGTWKILPFRTHAFIELAEGIVVLAAALLLVAEPLPRFFLAVMGGLQFGAFAFSDYSYDPRPSEKNPLGVRVDGHGVAPHE